MDKLKINDLKAIIKQYVFQKPITRMKKAELKAYAIHLQANGTLKNKKHTKLEGEGIMDLFKSQKLELSNTAKNILQKFGNLYITNIKLFTETVAGVSHASANIATMGALTRFKNKTGTSLFHIGCIITLANGQQIKFEKEEIPMLLTDTKLGPQAQFMEVPLQGKLITLQKLVMNTEKGMTPAKFYKYEGLRNNCQDMMMGMLKANGLLTPELQKWGKQDITELQSTVPTINEKIMNAVTGFKAKLRSVTGYGKPGFVKTGCGFAEENAKIKAGLQKKKNIQNAEYSKARSDVKNDDDMYYERMIESLIRQTDFDEASLRKMDRKKLIQMFEKENKVDFYLEKKVGITYDGRKNILKLEDRSFKLTETKELDKYIIEVLAKRKKDEEDRIEKERQDKLIEQYEKEGFVLMPNRKLALDGNEYEIDDEEGIKQAKITLFRKIDKANSFALSLGEKAFEWGWHYDEDEAKWFMINPHLQVRQYMNTLQDVVNLSGHYVKVSDDIYDNEKATYENAMQLSWRMASDNFFYDEKYNAYSKWSKDAFSRLDDFTGGILSTALSFVPPPYNEGVHLLQSLSKLTTGSESGDPLKFIESLNFKKLKGLTGRGKERNDSDDEKESKIEKPVLSFRCELSHKLGKSKLSDKEIINHLEKLHGSGVLKDMFANAVSKVTNALVPKPKHEAVISSPLVPDTKILFKMNEASYSAEPKGIEPYKRILKTPYLAVYRDGKTVIVAVRGTDVKDKKDLVADVAIALGQLKSTPRFKADVEELKKLRQNPELKNLYWIGTGHSLGSALVDEFLKLGLISEAVTFNGAVSKEFYNINNKNRRIYLKNDPLYLMMGRNTKYHEVRETKLDITKAHSLKNFEGGKKR